MIESIYLIIGCLCCLAVADLPPKLLSVILADYRLLYRQWPCTVHTHSSAAAQDSPKLSTGSLLYYLDGP